MLDCGEETVIILLRKAFKLDLNIILLTKTKNGQNI